MSTSDSPMSGYRATQASTKTTVVCDVQQRHGDTWRSVHVVRKDDDPDTAVRLWLAVNREAGEEYRTVRTIKTVTITVDPA